MTNKNMLAVGLITVWIVLLFPFWAAALDAAQLVEDSFNYVRGKASIATVVMTIHRPDWQREMTIKAWTRGQKERSRQWHLKKGARDVDIQPQSQPRD